MSMSMPGQVRPTITGSAVMKKCGLLRAAIGSDHLIVVQPKDKDGKPMGPSREVYTRVRDRLYHPDAKAVLVCLHERCRGKSWKNEQAMRAEHPDQLRMEKQGEAHVYAAWSEDPVDPGDKTQGVIGLLSAADPNV